MRLGLFNPPNFLISPTIQGTVLAGTGLTLPAFTLGGTVTATGQEIDAAILDACVAKGTWTASGTWTIPAVTLGGNITVNGKSFDAGAGSATILTTNADDGLVIVSTQDAASGVKFYTRHHSASPAINDLPFHLSINGRNSTPANVAYHDLYVKLDNVTAGTEVSHLEWNLQNSGVNLAMTLSGPGVLAVDLGGSGGAAQVDLFDDYDDALVLRQGIQQNNREMLADMGILERKNSGSGYMMKVQPMVRLLAGGIYQSRAMIDSLQEKVSQLESKLMLLEARNG